MLDIDQRMVTTGETLLGSSARFWWGSYGRIIMGRVRKAIAVVRKYWSVATDYEQEKAVDFLRNRDLFEVRLTLELLEKHYGSAFLNEEYKFGFLHRALSGELNDWGDLHADEVEIKRFSQEWLKEGLCDRVIGCDKTAFEGYTPLFSSWLANVMHGMVKRSTPGFFHALAFDLDYGDRWLSWSGWRGDNVSWAED